LRAFHVAETKVGHILVEFLRRAHELVHVIDDDPETAEHADRGDLVAAVAQVGQFVARPIAPVPTRNTVRIASIEVAGVLR
jgi:hypothetical protein